jgi:hypothetical protein
LRLLATNRVYFPEAAPLRDRDALAESLLPQLACQRRAQIASGLCTCRIKEWEKQILWDGACQAEEEGNLKKLDLRCGESRGRGRQKDMAQSPKLVDSMHVRKVKK